MQRLSGEAARGGAWWLRSILFLLSLLLLTAGVLSTRVQPLLGHCTMFGHCDTYYSGETSKPIDCFNDPPVSSAPATFPMPGCPHLEYSNVCCDESQYAQFVDGFALLSLFLHTCPACEENFRSLLCALSCGGDQAAFTRVTATERTSANGTVVTAANVSVSLEVMQRLFDSCRNVHYSGMGTPLFDTFSITSPQSIFPNLISTSDRSPVLYSADLVPDDAPSISTTNLHRDLFACDNRTSNYTCNCGDCPTVCNRCPQQVAVNDSSMLVVGEWPAFGHNYLHPVVYACAAGFALYVGAMLLAAVVAQWGRRGSPLSSSGRARSGLLAVAAVASAAMTVYAVSAVWVWVSDRREVTVADEAGMVNVLSSWIDPLYLAFLVASFAGALTTLLILLARHTRVHPHSFTYHPAAFSSSSSSSAPGDPVAGEKPSTLLGQYSAFIAGHPFLVLGCALLLTALCGLGLLSARLETDPVTLWVSPSSQVLKDKEYFDATFGPFYRTEQFILTSSASPDAPIVTAAAILFLANLTAAVRALTIPFADNGTLTNVTLEQLCYRPIPGQGCVVESALEWFNRTDAVKPPPTLDGRLTDDDVVQWVTHCGGDVIDDACRGSIGAPSYPYIVLGGYNGTIYSTATALVTTFPLDNLPGNTARAEAWEQGLLDLLGSAAVQQSVAERGLRLDYMMERSVADEIKRGTYKDVDIIVLSYVVMFVYISAALSSGNWRSPPSSRMWSFPLHTKCALGLGAMAIVVCSLVISVGLVSVAGVAVTPIISEVIPFLVLAIGIDNVFLLSQAFRRQPVHLSPAVRLERTLSEVGVGIALAAASECGAFLLGASTDMPAVQAFAAISAVAIAVDWLLQMTAFCAVMLLDARRLEDGRWDLCPCVRDEKVKREVDAWKADTDDVDAAADDGDEEGEDDDVEPGNPSTTAGHVQQDDDDADDPTSPSPFASESYLQRGLRRYYLPFLLHPFTRLVVLLLFPLLFFALVSYGLTHIQLGLDQATVVPDDSYLQEYFAAEARYLNVGPPVYFVVRNDSAYDYAAYTMQDRVCNAVSRCDDRSLEGIVSAAACSPGSYIAQPASSWMDTYMVWLTSEACCGVLSDAPGVLAPAGTCSPGEDDDECLPCTNATSYTAPYGRQRPPPDVFAAWLQSWLVNSTCSEVCGFCSAGLYDSLTFSTTPPAANDTLPLPRTRVEASRYMTYHTPLRTQADFIGAITSAHAISDDIAREQSLDVFPYSVVYVYFQQYLDLQRVAVLNVGLAFVAILALSLALLRCVWISVLQVATIAMIVGDLMGCMALWDVDLNALSVLNVIMAIGISVEFCIHIATRFLLTPSASKSQRAAHAVYTVGASVVEGITLTKVTGVLVLALATSAVFHIYYFRMYLLIVVLGVAHGLVWLPVVLSVAGSPPQMRGAGCCGGWMWGWPWESSEAVGRIADEPWVVVSEDGEHTSDDEGPDAVNDDDEDDEEVAQASRVRSRPVDERERGLLGEEAQARGKRPSPRPRHS